MDLDGGWESGEKNKSKEFSHRCIFELIDKTAIILFIIILNIKHSRHDSKHPKHFNIQHIWSTWHKTYTMKHLTWNIYNMLYRINMKSISEQMFNTRRLRTFRPWVLAGGPSGLVTSSLEPFVWPKQKKTEISEVLRKYQKYRQKL